MSSVCPSVVVPRVVRTVCCVMTAQKDIQDMTLMTTKREGKSPVIRVL